jgi:hypothetical protein
VRYLMPNYPCEFEIPDAWLAEAGFDKFTPSAPAYHSDADGMKLVPLREIEPPYRLCAYAKDWLGFDRARLVDVLKGIVDSANIKPVPLMQLPPGNRLVIVQYRYRVRDGFHRFYASIAAGFEFLPATVNTLEELSELATDLWPDT